MEGHVRPATAELTEFYEASLAAVAEAVSLAGAQRHRSSPGVLDFRVLRHGNQGETRRKQVRARPHYDGIVAFSHTDFTEDLKKITVPVLVMHGDDDQIVRYADFWAPVRQARTERHAEDIRRIPARYCRRRRKRSTLTFWRSSSRDQALPCRVASSRRVRGNNTSGPCAPRARPLGGEAGADVRCA
jgi:hypothetical protein